MSEFAIKIKGYYDNGLWNIDRVNKALELGKITSDEYTNIIGKRYISDKHQF